MKWCIPLPEETVLVVRPSFNAICMDNKPAAKLLSVLMYRHSIRKEHQSDADNMNIVKRQRGEHPDQDTTYRIFRKQQQLVNDMCGEITEKTLHDVAVPMLQLLGYLDIEEHLACNCYMLNLEAIQASLHAYTHTPYQLESFLINHLQLEKFLIDKKNFLSAQKDKDGLEIFLIDKKKFLLQLEKVLIWNRNISNCQRGRKTAPKEALGSKNEKPKNKRESKSNNKKENTLPPAATGNDDSLIPSFGPDELLLLEWITEKGIIRAKSADTVSAQIKKLSSCVKVEMLHKYCELARSMTPGDGILRLGNLVNQKVMDAWKQQEAQSQTVIVADSVTVEAGMSRETADQLLEDMKAFNPSLITAIDDSAEQRCFVGLAVSSTEWIDIGNPDDWYYLPGNLVEQAVKHGEWSRQELKEAI